MRSLLLLTGVCLALAFVLLLLLLTFPFLGRQRGRQSRRAAACCPPGVLAAASEQTSSARACPHLPCRAPTSRQDGVLFATADTALGIASSPPSFRLRTLCMRQEVGCARVHTLPRALLLRCLR